VGWRRALLLGRSGSVVVTRIDEPAGSRHRGEGAKGQSAAGGSARGKQRSRRGTERASSRGSPRGPHPRQAHESDRGHARAV
jgi:hypothetical protein